MTLEQLKDRIEATCNKNGIFPTYIKTELINGEIALRFMIKNGQLFGIKMPNTDLLLEAVDLECRAIKARQSSATNGIDE